MGTWECPGHGQSQGTAAAAARRARLVQVRHPGQRATSGTSKTWALDRATLKLPSPMQGDVIMANGSLARKEHDSLSQTGHCISESKFYVRASAPALAQVDL